MKMSSPRKPKEVMSLVSRVVVLSHFVLWATYCSTPFFDVLKGSKKFEWTYKCEQAFLALKEYLGRLPLLSKTVEREKLYLYLTIFEEAISAALAKKEEKV